MCDSTSVSHPNEEKKLSQNSHMLLSTRYSLYITGECISEEIITNNILVILLNEVEFLVRAIIEPRCISTVHL